MLILSRKIGEWVRLKVEGPCGEPVIIQLKISRRSGAKGFQLAFDAPPEVEIARQEIIGREAHACPRGRPGCGVR